MHEQSKRPSCDQEILVVDDAVENLRLLATLLRQTGYVVRCVNSGEMALRSARAYPPDLILLDIMMPSMDGYEVCQRLKADPATAEIPVIFISALDPVSERSRALAAGGMDYIAKPYQVQDVLSKVQRGLTRLSAIAGNLAALV